MRMSRYAPTAACCRFVAAARLLPQMVVAPGLALQQPGTALATHLCCWMQRTWAVVAVGVLAPAAVAAARAQHAAAQQAAQQTAQHMLAWQGTEHSSSSKVSSTPPLTGSLEGSSEELSSPGSMSSKLVPSVSSWSSPDLGPSQWERLGRVGGSGSSTGISTPLQGSIPPSCSLSASPRSAYTLALSARAEPPVVHPPALGPAAPHLLVHLFAWLPLLLAASAAWWAVLEAALALWWL